LVGDGFEQSFVGALEVVGVHLERLRFGDQEFQLFVAFGQGFRSFRQVKGRGARCVCHILSNLETGG
jgi:hypothetical protein